MATTQNAAQSRASRKKLKPKPKTVEKNRGRRGLPGPQRKKKEVRC